MRDYAVRWNDVWQEYVEFAQDQDQKHPSRVLAQEMTNTRLSQHLMSLENYYGIVRQPRGIGAE
jgi:hypothetical protein